MSDNEKIQMLFKALARQEAVLANLISYLHRELGTAAATELLNDLNKPIIEIKDN